MSSSKKELKLFFGAEIDNIDLTMININTNNNIGTEKSNSPSCLEYINHSLILYPSLMKAYNERKEKQPTIDNTIVANEIFIPVCISPSSCIKLTYPKKFGGDHRSEAQFQKLGIYSTHQLFAKYTNGNICAALAGRFKFSSNPRKIFENVIPTQYTDKNDIDYVMSRGIVTDVGDNAVDILRYIIAYKKPDNKFGISLISGDYDMMMGYVNLMPILEKNIFSLRENIKHDQFKGINLDSISIGNKSSNDVEGNSITISRIISGAILIVDHLKILKSIYNVDTILEFNLDSSEEPIPIEIDSVIMDYQRIKNYYIMLHTLNAIK